MEVLSQADEKYSRQYELKRLGINLEWLEKRVAKIYGIYRIQAVSGGGKSLSGSVHTHFE